MAGITEIEKTISAKISEDLLVDHQTQAKVQQNFDRVFQVGAAPYC